MTRKAWSARQGRSSKWCARPVRLAIYLRDRFTCQYCGADLTGRAPAELALDHLRPRCKGGSDAPTNLVTACRRCNSGRQDRPWWTYATPGAADRIRRQRRRPLNLVLARKLMRGEV